jgi:large subunit ribosomal protein L5
MALRELPFQFSKLRLRDTRCIAPSLGKKGRRNVSSEAVESGSEHLQDLDPLSSLAAPGPSEEIQKSFDPVGQSQLRKRQLPKSR